MNGRRQKSPISWDKSAPEQLAQTSRSRSRERAVATIAARQLRLINASQLRESGYSRNAIHNAANRGRLQRLHHGVYATHPPPFSREQRWLAAVLACGPGALLSHEPSAILQGFLESGTPIPHVTVPTGRGRSRHGLVVHRGLVDPRDRRRIGSIPCTSADRVIVDLAPSLDEAGIERLLVAAESLGLVKRGRLCELVEERRGRPGIGRLTTVLALEPALTRSDLEAMFMPVWRLANVPRPRVNWAVAVPTEACPLTVEFAWPELKLAVELDSQRFHGDWEQAERDRERDQSLALAGWVCHRFVRRAVATDPRAVAERLQALWEIRVKHLG
jgi:hypothetical protein